VFVTTATDDGAACRVICLDRRTGQIRWNTEVYRLTPAKKEGRNSYATPTPVTDGRRVYAVFSDGGVAALTFDGKVAWLNRDHKFHGVHGCGASPTLHDDLIIFPYDITSDGEDKTVGHTKPWDKSFILALDKNTGRLRWKAKRGMSRVAHVTPQVINVNGRAQLVSAAGDVVQGFDLRTGELVWWAASAGEGVVPSVVVGDGLVFTASGFGDPTIRAFRAGGKGDVTNTHLAWQVKKAVPMIPSFVHANGHVFTISEGGIALCIKADTGEVVWQERVGGKHYASPVYADGKIYFLSEAGESVIIKADPRFEVVARNQLGETCQASYAVSRGQLFIRTEQHLYCIGAGQGR
jgi:outer membrane protein assembly factor BamB